MCGRRSTGGVGLHVGQRLIFDLLQQDEDFYLQGVRQRQRDLNKRACKDMQYMFDRVFHPHPDNQQLFEATERRRRRRRSGVAPRRRRVGTPPGRCRPVAARQCRHPPPVDHGVAAVRRHAGLLRQHQSDCAPLGVGGGARDAPSRRRRGLEDGRHVHDTAGGGGGGSAAGGGGRRAVAGRTDRQTTERQTDIIG